MLLNNAFIRKEYRTVLANVFFFYVFGIAGQLVDNILAGRLFGEIGMSAVEIVSPVYSAYAGIGFLFSVGFQIMHTREMGRFHREKASQLFLQAEASGLVMGLLLMLLAMILRESYFNVSGCEGQLREHAREYYRFYPCLGLIYPFFYVLINLAENDGDGLNLILGSVISTVLNIVLSLLFSRTIGLAGLSLGTFLSVLCNGFFLLLHLARKSCSICRCRFRFNWREQLELFSYGLYGCIGYVCVALTDVLLHGFILAEYEEGYLAAYSMVNLFLDFAVIFEAFSASGNAIAGVYMGEKNQTGVKITLHTILRALLIMGALYMLIFLIGDTAFPRLYGIETPYVLDAAKFTCIVMALSGVFVSALYLPMNMSSCIGHPKNGILFSLCFNGIFPLALGVPLGLVFGYRGLVWGISLTPLVTMLVCFALMRLLKGKEGFPYYLGKEEYASSVYCASSGKDSFAPMLDAIEKDLQEKGVSREQSLHVRLLCEEITIRIFEKNAPKRVVLEFSILVDAQSILLVERDDGVLFDVNENDTLISSVNTYLLPLLMSKERTMEHLITTSNNRNGISIRRE